MSQIQRQSIMEAELIEENEMWTSSSLSNPKSDLSEGLNSDKNEETKSTYLEKEIRIKEIETEIQKNEEFESMKVNSKSEKESDVLIKKIKNFKEMSMKVDSKTIDRGVHENKTDSNRKKIPNEMKEIESSDIDEEPKEKEHEKPNIKNYQTEVLSNYRKNKYRKKNFQFEDKITQIADIEEDSRNVNIKGEIIFIWTRQLLNEKWAKTEMVCLDIYDGSGSVLTAIPEKYVNKNLWDFEIGKWVEFKRVEGREKFPKKLCMLVTEKSIVKVIESHQIPTELRIEPSKLGFSLDSMETNPIGGTCNCVCLVIEKNEKQYIRNAKGHELTISKITIFDPISNKYAFVKLWEEKTDLNFYTNGTVYLLRGIEIKEFKNGREYHASKDFNFRGLSFSEIEAYLKPVWEERWKKLDEIPSKIESMTVQDSLMILKKQLINKRQENRCEENLEKTSPKLETEANYFARKMPNSKERILISWSISTIKIMNIEISTNYNIKYFQCQECQSKTMSNCRGQTLCDKCGCEDSIHKYWIKCEFYDGNDNFYGEASERAGSKMLSVEDEPLRFELLEQMTLRFKKSIANELLGDAVKAIVATTKEELSESVWVTGYYIVDILPFDETLTESTQLDLASEANTKSVSVFNLR